MKNTILMFTLLSLISCGKNGKNGANGSDGATLAGINGSSTGVDFEDISPGLGCPTGGVTIFTFKDDNADGFYQSEESILKVKALCNGLNGENGSDGLDGQNGANGENGTNGTNGTNGSNASVTLESVLTSATCPNGGVKITSGNATPVEVCNGVNGLNGEQGIQGVQGIPGMAGSSGNSGGNGNGGGNPHNLVTPVKFCANDNSTFPEYGLLIAGELFAVYWGTTPASPSKPQAFLTKIVAGNYQSTGGNNCLFTVE